MLDGYRKLLALRKRYVVGHERRADALYQNGVLTMQVPAAQPHLRIEATLERNAILPPKLDTEWTEVLRSEEDGYAVRVSTKLQLV